MPEFSTLHDSATLQMLSAFSFAFCLFSSQFCEVITLSWLQHLSGKVVRVMLDYVDQVQICSKLKSVLEKQKLWSEIHFILSEYLSYRKFLPKHLSSFYF